MEGMTEEQIVAELKEAAPEIAEEIVRRFAAKGRRVAVDVTDDGLALRYLDN
jgi:hypothetical protein